MTRLSDSLRGLADRAPIDHATVSVAGAARRIQRGRRLRAAANATAGVGVAAVVALAALHPGGSAGLSAPEGADAGRGAGGAAEPAIAGMEDQAYVWEWGACGSRPLDDGIANQGYAAMLDVAVADTVAEPGEAVSGDLTLAPGGDVADVATTGTATVIIMWDGYAVARTDVAAVYTDGVASFEAPLVNCWDGSMLPAGDYEMLVVQGVSPVAFDVPVEDIVETGDGTEDVPAPDATPPGSVEPGPDGSVSVTVEPQPAVENIVSNTVSLQITGERIDYPFDSYLWRGEPIEYPEDYLTPQAARSEYAARVTREPWNMAAGTQRVVMTHDGLNADTLNYANSQYFGCAWDGAAAQGFPQESAKWNLLDVESTLPKQLSVSYGWVVDDNPEASLSVTNLSEYSLPGFWAEPNATLMLVKDGKVVAETYLSAIDRYGSISMYSEDGMLAPGTSVDGHYLWRDVSGCWLGNAPKPVEPGTYTVLNVHSLYLDNGAAGMYAEPYLSDGAEGGEARSAIAPFPSADYVEMQVWTSLGTITVN